MKKVIIFGATGTVGAYTSLFLKDLGYDVIAVGRRKSDNNFFRIIKYRTIRLIFLIVKALRYYLTRI